MLTINLLQALPRTPLWDRLKREQRLIEDDDSRESNVVFRLPYEQVLAMWRECMRVAYPPEKLYRPLRAPDPRHLSQPAQSAGQRAARADLGATSGAA